jgi:glycosyltransferase involved in cell wall biosynthesis
MSAVMTKSVKLSDSLVPGPMVSVVIPAYNTSRFIGETLDSVFTQTFDDYEVIVVNDGSPDTCELEKVLEPYWDRILYIVQENRGLAGARNSAIRRARGKYLAFLDSDDCWLPEYLESQLRILQDMPAIDAVYCDAAYFGNPRLAGKTYMQICPSKGPVTFESLLRENTQVIVSCTVVRRDAVLEAGLFDETLRRCEDYDLWLRIVSRGGRILYHRKVLARYRSRVDSLSNDELAMNRALLNVYQKIRKMTDLHEGLRAILEAVIARTQACIDVEVGKQLLAAGDFARAKDSLTRAHNFSHSLKLKLAIIGLQFAPRLTRWCWCATRGGNRPSTGRITPGHPVAIPNDKSGPMSYLPSQKD